MEKKTYILCAAIYFNDEKKHYHQPKNIEIGFVLTGRMHHNIFAIFTCLGLDRNDFGKQVQGFITSDNQFVNRTEGSRIAFNAEQIKNEKDKLYSEDLY